MNYIVHSNPPTHAASRHQAVPSVQEISHWKKNENEIIREWFLALYSSVVKLSEKIERKMWSRTMFPIERVKNSAICLRKSDVQERNWRRQVDNRQRANGTIDIQERKRKVDSAIKRVAAGAHLPTPRLFEPMRNAQTIEPITSRTAVSSPCGSTKY